MEGDLKPHRGKIDQCIDGCHVGRSKDSSAVGRDDDKVSGETEEKDEYPNSIERFTSQPSSHVGEGDERCTPE